jgi:hypothetical protein
MAYQFTGATPNLLGFTLSPAIGAAYPGTLAAWIYPDTLAANQGVIKFILDATGDSHLIQVGSTPTNLSAISIKQGVSAGTANVATLVTTTWQFAGAIFTSSASRNAILNSTIGATETTSVSSPAIDGIQVSWGATGTPFNGRLAAMAAWTAALNTSELASLAKGFSPRRIRPQSLIMYCPMIRDLRELRQNLPNYASWVVYHPTTIHPHPSQYGF